MNPDHRENRNVPTCHGADVSCLLGLVARSNRERLATLMLASVAVGIGLPVTGQILEQKLVPSDQSQNDQLGYSVALIPGWAICATPFDDDIQGQSGALYVYRDSGPDWMFVQKLKASDPTFGGALGTAIAADGEWIVATAPIDDPQGYFGRGSAHVYNLQGGSWIHAQKILASDFTLGTQAYFGSSAAVSGGLMVIGEEDDSANAYHSGSAYVFQLTGATWSEVAKLYASDPETSASFGDAVATDGHTIVVGALLDGEGVATLDRGAVYVFEFIGGSWVETQKLLGSDIEKSENFGMSVAIDGDTIVVGSNHDHSITNDGAMYVFERQGGAWTETQELLSMDPVGGPDLGKRVALSNDCVVGSGYGDDDLGSTAGAAYVFRRTPSGQWLQLAKVLAPDGQSSDLLGIAVDICGNRVMCGAKGDDDACPSNPGCNSGSAYIFEFAPDATQYGSCPTQGPCGNHDDFGGCRTSSGQGGVLNAAGSSSVGSNDLRLEARWLPPNKLGLFFMGGIASALPFGDGQICVASGGMGIWRYNPPQSSGTAGVLQLGPGVPGLSAFLPPGGHISPGQTWHFQAWFRDPAGPCGKGSNMTNGVRVTFGP